MRGFGGMVSFQVAGGEDAAVAQAARTEIFTLAESLGGVESLIEVPGPMTHASVAGSPCEVPAQLVRLSVGLEHVDDLLEDLIHSLQKHVEVDEPEPTDMPLLTSNVPGSVGEQTAGGEDVVEFEQMTEEELLRGLEGMPPAESPGSQRNGY